MKSKITKSIFVAGILAASVSYFTASAQEKGKVVVKEKEIVKREKPNGSSGAEENLSDEQKKKIKEINLKANKEIDLLENQADEKKAHLKTLAATDKPDMNEVNKTIDDMMQLKASMMKKKAAKLMEIRNLLTDEQKMWFDKKHKEDSGSGDKKGPPPMRRKPPVR